MALKLDPCLPKCGERSRFLNLLVRCDDAMALNLEEIFFHGCAVGRHDVVISVQAVDNLGKPFEVLLECGLSFKVKWLILFFPLDC